MPGSSEYECGECRHSFRMPEGAARDTRLLMCPACGSIDLNLITVQRAPAAIWTSREAVPSQQETVDRAKSAS
jgi:DNA-directed RNA polymerase subunit RPC12/RpoP